MKIYLKDQSRNFEKHLHQLMQAPVMPYDKKKLRENTSSIDIALPKSLEEINLDFFFRYQIFPPATMTYLTEWDAEGRSMRVGDTIVQQVFIPPVRSASQKIIFGVRMNAIIDTPHEKGFSYETLAGHVERGVSSFILTDTPTGITFTIHTFSEPANPLTKLLAPVFSLPYQSYCTRKALEYVKEQLEVQR